MNSNIEVTPKKWERREKERDVKWEERWNKELRQDR